MKNAKQGNIFECTTPTCKGWCEFETGRKIFLCYLCAKPNCLECMVNMCVIIQEWCHKYNCFGFVLFYLFLIRRVTKVWIV